MGRYGNIDYPSLTKRAFLFGVGLFLIGEVGEFVIHTYLEDFPGWMDPVLFYLTVIGLLTFFLSPFIFGILLPLTE